MKLESSMNSSESTIYRRKQYQPCALLLFCFVSIASITASSDAHAQSYPPLNLEARHGFGTPTRTPSFILVEVKNNMPREITTPLYFGSHSNPRRYTREITVPADATRVFPVEVPMSGDYGFDVSAPIPLVNTASVSFYRSGNAFPLVFDEQGHFETLVRSVAPDEVGVVSRDPNGDPIAPREPWGWNGVDSLFVTTRALAQLDVEQRGALRTYAETNGLTVFMSATTPEQRQSAIVREFCPSPCGLDEGIDEWYLGRSRILFVNKNLDDPAQADELARRLVSNTALHRQPPSIDMERYSDRLLSIVDPAHNSLGTSLGLAAILLLIYVLLVGPFNFNFIQKRNQPLLALITTPVLAAVCFFLLFGVGLASKGVTMRYNRASVLVMNEGSSLSVTFEKLGLFSARGHTDEIHLDGAVGPAESNYSLDSRSFPSYSGTLWSTSMVHRRVWADVGGPVIFGWENGSLTSVQNNTPFTIHEARIVTSSSVAVIGDLTPGAAAPVSSTSPGGPMWPGNREVALFHDLHFTNPSEPTLIGLIEREENDIGPFSADETFDYIYVRSQTHVLFAEGL